MTSFARAIAAEFAKIFSTRGWWILAIVLFLYIAALAAGLGGLIGSVDGASDAFGTGGVEGGTGLAPLIYSFASSVGYVFPVLLGALAATGEFRHQTLTPTFLTNPRRGDVLAAKVIALFVIGLLLGAVALVASVGIGGGVLSLAGIDTAFDDPDTWALIARSLLAMGLWAVIGVGLGALVPSQVASIVIVLAFTQFIEPVLRLAASFADWTATVGQYLPGAASDALVGASFFTIAGGNADSLEWWQGGLVLVAYAAVTAIGGYFVSWKRDVT
ncbi:ABC transporter permease [Marisediminicola sp. LYQ134]|uniref:ABC transporter permease n=1 Tax=Marisediminicola sp. LYQ134 TaxID=3391061 RepID=UPI0039831BF7